jgi:DNA polymerase-1
MERKSLCLVDGSGYIFRAYHALPPLNKSDGTPLGAVYGFTGMLSKLIAANGKDYLAVIFDAGRRTFRNDIYADYKAHRPPPPEDLIPQFPLMRKVCEAFDVPCIELEYYEADDLIASYATQAEALGMEVSIISSDKDLMQLVSEQTTLWDPIKAKHIDHAAVIEKFGVGPEFVIDVQALAGDSSDNVPGVPGIGVKTAAQLIHTYGSLEGLLENIDSIKQPKRREKLYENQELARISKQLVTLKKDVTLPLALEECVVRKPVIEKVVAFLDQCEFKTLHRRVMKELFSDSHSMESHAPPEGLFEEMAFLPPLQVSIITTFEALESVFQKAHETGVCVFDVETTALHIHDAALVGLALQVDAHHSYYVPIAHKDAPLEQLPLDTVLAFLKKILNTPSILKIAHNIKYDLGVLFKYGMEDIMSYDDTLLMSYALDGGRHLHNMDYLAKKYFAYDTISFKDITGSGKKQITFDCVDVDTAARYAGEDAHITFHLHKLLKDRLLFEKRNALYYDVDQPIVPAIVAMETKGMRVDEATLDAAARDFSKRLLALEENIYAQARCTFNIGSPKQLGDILFNDLSLPLPKKSKTGAYVTDADVLEKLAAQGHSIADDVLQWRSLSKLMSTYIEGLKKAIHPKTQRVHTSFALTGTTTGRLASSDPNLQNIPIKSLDGRLIRQAFVASPNHVMMSFDYSQIELRLLAHVACIDPLIEAFKQGQDIHTLTASHVFEKPLQSVTPEDRRHAKAINFGIIYGISAFGLARQLNMSKNMADHYIKQYFERYPGIQEYMQACVEQAKTHGYVETLWKRRCYTPDIHNKNYMLRQFAERQAINAPLQGSNADMMRLMMGHIPNLLKKHAMRGKLLLQVHDEFLFDVPIEEVDVMKKIIQHAMERVVTLKVPLSVGVGVGPNWDEAH